MKRLLSLVTIIVLLGALAAPVAAQEGSEAGAAEDALIVSNDADSGPGSFRQAMSDASGSTGADTIAFTGVFDINLASTVTVSGSPTVTVNGNGSTINGGSTVQIINASAPLVLNNLILEFGTSPVLGGGAVLSTETVVINDSTLRSNSSGANADGGAINAPDVIVQDSTITSILNADEARFGGAIFATNVDLINTEVTQMDADRGGAVQASDIDVIDSTLADNEASQIGGVLRGTEVTVTRSSVTNNDAPSGGALDGTVIDIADSVFSGNTSSGVGAAVRAIENPVVTITNSVLRDNDASNNGGAVSAQGSATADVTVTGSILTGNEGSSGGAIDSSSPAGTATVTVQGSTLTGNDATNSGGGVSVFGASATTTVQNSTLTGNDANNAGGAVSASGGAVTTIDLTHTTIAGNTSNSGASLEAQTLNSFGSVVTVDSGEVACATTTTLSTGYSYGNDGTCGFTTAAGDVDDGDDPLLSPLRDNGDLLAAAEAGGDGTARPTAFPLNGSPLVDAVPAASCSVSPEVDGDQRGVVRPTGEGCDIGAIEAIFPRHSQNDVTPFFEASVRWITSTVNTPQILNGFPDGSFGQELNITRGQAARLYYRGAGTPDVSATPAHGFSDVTPFYEDAVTWAKDAGLFNGFPDNTFRQTEPITRGQYIRSLYSFAGAQNTAGLDPHGLSDVTPFYEDSVKWAKHHGLANGFPDLTFRQDNDIKRGNAGRTFYNTAQTPDAWAIPGIAHINMIFRPNT